MIRLLKMKRCQLLVKKLLGGVGVVVDYRQGSVVVELVVVKAGKGGEVEKAMMEKAGKGQKVGRVEGKGVKEAAVFKLSKLQFILFKFKLKLICWG